MAVIVGRTCSKKFVGRLDPAGGVGRALSRGGAFPAGRLDDRVEQLGGRAGKQRGVVGERAGVQRRPAAQKRALVHGLRVDVGRGGWLGGRFAEAGAGELD